MIVRRLSTDVLSFILPLLSCVGVPVPYMPGVPASSRTFLLSFLTLLSVCVRMLPVCCSYVLVCDSYVTRTLPYVLVYYSYVVVCYSYVLVQCFHDPHELII